MELDLDIFLLIVKTIIKFSIECSLAFSLFNNINLAIMISWQAKYIQYWYGYLLYVSLNYKRC